MSNAEFRMWKAEFFPAHLFNQRQLNTDCFPVVSHQQNWVFQGRTEFRIPHSTFRIQFPLLFSQW